jgi:hypothetical protein
LTSSGRIARLPEFLDVFNRFDKDKAGLVRIVTIKPTAYGKARVQIAGFYCGVQVIRNRSCTPHPTGSYR